MFVLWSAVLRLHGAQKKLDCAATLGGINTAVEAESSVNRSMSRQATLRRSKRSKAHERPPTFSEMDKGFMSCNTAPNGQRWRLQRFNEILLSSGANCRGVRLWTNSKPVPKSVRLLYMSVVMHCNDCDAAKAWVATQSQPERFGLFQNRASHVCVYDTHTSPGFWVNQPAAGRLSVSG